MWIEDKDGNLYNLDFAQAILLKTYGSSDKTYRIEAVLHTEKPPRRSPFNDSESVVVLLSTDNEEKAKNFLAHVKAKLGTL